MQKNIILFMAAFLLVGSFVFYVAKKPPKTEPQPPIEKPKQEEKPAPVPYLQATIDVDFYNASLDSVVTFVTALTKKGIVYNGRDDVLISWTAQNVRVASLFDAFQEVLGAYNLTMRPINDQATTFEIVRLRDIPVPVRLDYAWSSRGLYFWFNNTIYAYDKMPYPVRRTGNSWFALVPASESTAKKQPPPLTVTKKPETPDQPSATENITHGKI